MAEKVLLVYVSPGPYLSGFPTIFSMNRPSVGDLLALNPSGVRSHRIAKVGTSCRQSAMMSTLFNKKYIVVGNANLFMYFFFSLFFINFCVLIETMLNLQQL